MFEVTHIARQAAGENSLGQAIYTTIERTRQVYGWRVRTAVDGAAAALDDRTITEVYLLTPDGDFRDGDRVRLPDGREFTVHGEPEDFNTGPFGYQPGYRVLMRRVIDGQA